MSRALKILLTQFQGTSIYRKITRSITRGIAIKEASREDTIKARAWIDRNFNKEDASSRLTPNVTDFVAKNGAKIVGFAQLVRRPDNSGPYSGYWLFGLTVKFLYRGMGIGERLTDAIIRKAGSEGARELSLIVRKDRAPAVNLYRKLGFRPRIIPDLEEKLEGERLKHGYKRMVMARELA
jgi:ribosomal protein S18 acetylase RimI-like enzyme